MFSFVCQSTRSEVRKGNPPCGFPIFMLINRECARAPVRSGVRTPKMAPPILRFGFPVKAAQKGHPEKTTRHPDERTSYSLVGGECLFKLGDSKVTQWQSSRPACGSTSSWPFSNTLARVEPVSTCIYNVYICTYSKGIGDQMGDRTKLCTSLTSNRTSVPARALQTRQPLAQNENPAEFHLIHILHLGRKEPNILSCSISVCISSLNTNFKN